MAGDFVSVIDLEAGGIALVKASGAIAAGRVLVPSTTAGKAGSVANIAGLSSDQMGFGIAMEAASAANEVIKFKVRTITESG